MLLKLETGNRKPKTGKAKLISGSNRGDETRNPVIHLSERNFKMLKKEHIFRNPLRLADGENEDGLPAGGFGAILARAGLGKTSLLVQLAIDGLLRNKNVLHISLGDPVRKVCLWYEEVFRNITDRHNIQQAEQLWESLLPHRLIMTFNVEDFTVPKLEERLTDLREQNIFQPRIILIDGLPLPFDRHAENAGTSAGKILGELKKLVHDHAMSAWFTIRVHRHEAAGPDGLPISFSNVADFFELAFQLLPDKKDIHVKAVKGGEPDHPVLLLDPATMLVNGK